MVRNDPSFKGNRIAAQVLWIPGCGSVTEVQRAYSLGAEIIKVFPGSVLGPAFVKSVKDVLPQTRLMPTGGVTPEKENLKAWFQAGVSCVGMGSQLITKDILANGDYAILRERVEKALETISQIRNN